ncbi:MAG: 17.3 kDa unknown protein [Plant associated caulimovirus 1]|nr:MAG: 17.3 kDa unknown protein [Plant associated caulimovirus 1]
MSELPTLPQSNLAEPGQGKIQDTWRIVSNIQRDVLLLPKEMQKVIENNQLTDCKNILPLLQKIYDLQQECCKEINQKIDKLQTELSQKQTITPNREIVTPTDRGPIFYDPPPPPTGMPDRNRRMKNYNWYPKYPTLPSNEDKAKGKEHE